MSIKSQLDSNLQKLIIAIDGRFDFSAHKDFREAYEDLDAKPNSYQIDMTEAQYIDSSALGMLLLLRDHAGGDSADVEIINCNADVKKILTISNIDQLFTIA